MQMSQMLMKHFSRSIAFIMIFIILFIGTMMSSCAPKVQEEIEFSSQAEIGVPAYIQVKSIKPKYSVSVSAYSLKDIVCRCTTTSNKYVWLVISEIDYNEQIDPDARFGIPSFSTFDTINFSEEVIIHGTVKEADDISDDLSSKISTNKILDFISLEKSTDLKEVYP